MSTLRLIVGMSRGGTNSMTRALNQIPGVVAFGETLFWGRFYEPPDAEGYYQKPHLQRLIHRYHNFQIGPSGGVGGLNFSREHGGQVLLNAIKSVKPPITPSDLFRMIGRAIVEATGQNPETTAWVEKTPHHVMHAERILKADPSAKLVVMIRNPEDFLLSYKHIGDVKPPQAQKQFRTLYHPMTAAVVCRGYLKAALNATSNFPERVVICRFEEITTNFPETIKLVCRHLELPNSTQDTFPSANTSFRNSRSFQRPSLSSMDRAWLSLICRRPASQLGFSVQQQPKGLMIIFAFISSLQLIPWFCQNCQFISKKTTGGLYAVLKQWLGSP
jgi:hypothetical protein